MNRDELIQRRDQVKEQVVVWIVLTVCLQILTVFKILAFLKYIVWLSTIYTIVLILLWCYLEIRLLRMKDKNK